MRETERYDSWIYAKTVSPRTTVPIRLAVPSIRARFALNNNAEIENTTAYCVQFAHQRCMKSRVPPVSSYKPTVKGEANNSKHKIHTWAVDYTQRERMVIYRATRNSFLVLRARGSWRKSTHRATNDQGNQYLPIVRHTLNSCRPSVNSFTFLVCKQNH